MLNNLSLPEPEAWQFEAVPLHALLGKGGFVAASAGAANALKQTAATGRQSCSSKLGNRGAQMGYLLATPNSHCPVPGKAFTGLDKP